MSRMRKPAKSPATRTSSAPRARPAPDCAHAAGAIIARDPPRCPSTHKDHTMAVNTKRVFYVKYLAAPDYEATLARRPDVRLDKLENESPDEVAAPIMAAAHAYQIGSARDEI